MKGVNIKETRLIDQAIGKNNFRYLTLEEHAIVDKALKWLKESELYLSVWKDVEKKANEIVKEKCEPEWNRISEEMKKFWEEVNELSKERAEKKDDWTEEKEERLKALNDSIAELTNEYQKVTDEANEELNKYKEERINEESWACFFLEDDEYQFMWELCWFAAPQE